MFAHKHPSYSHMEGSDFPIYKTSPHVKTDRGGGSFIKIKKTVVIYTTARISYQQECKQLTEIFNAKSWKLKFLLGYIWY
jgi:hypothetical protein